MRKIIYIFIFSLMILSCKDELTYPKNDYFDLSEKQVNFSNDQGEQTVTVLNAQGAIKIKITSENSEWCTANVSGNTITIKVIENVRVKSRIAKIEVTDGKDIIELMVRQGQKYFTYIAGVTNLTAISGPGEITLKWDEPVEDNFSHVILYYKAGGTEHKQVLESGVTEYVIKGLKNSDGEHTFTLQSVDNENDLGQSVSVVGTPEKLVAFRFEKEIGVQWIPYYLRSTDTYSTTLKVGSMEFNMNEATTIAFETDESLLSSYNEENHMNLKLLPANSYSLPDNFQHHGTEAFQDLNIEIDASKLQDQSIYALPLRIKSAMPSAISDVMSSVVIVYSVEDLAGWYTVDWMPKNGESESQYPDNPAQRRRYIKRTGELTWETGYLFRGYTKDENNRPSGKGDIQFISIDPDTKEIVIRQGDYATSEDNNYYDFTENALYIEYLYSDWAGWWNHEKMHDRSLNK